MSSPHKKQKDTLITEETFGERFLKELNLCRKNPQKYSTKLRSYSQYFEKQILKIPNETPIKTKEGFSAFEECAMFLDNLDELPQLKLNEGLNYSSKEVIKNLLTYKSIEEINSKMKIDECLSKFGEVYGPFSQLCDFGTSNPELLVILLLVDDGECNRSNRLSLLNGNFKVIGFSHRNNHEIFNFCSVVLLARNFYSLNEKPIDDYSDDDDDYLDDNDICEEDNLYFEKKLGGKGKRKEKIVVDDFGKKIKIVKEIKVKNGVLYCDIFKEKI